MVEISSPSQSVRISPKEPTVIIGERINPTGKPKMQAKLKQGDLSFVGDLAQEQHNGGAHVIGVNLGSPGIDETELLAQAVTQLSQSCDLPLYIDSSRPEALLAAWKSYKGKPLLGSCTGEESSYRPIMEKLVDNPPGLVVMLHDELGVSQPPSHRLQVADKISRAAEKIGFPVANLVFDCMTMAVGADPKAGQDCLFCIEELAGRGHPTIIGLSNVSFGLPRRPLFNATFAAMAIQAGLAAAIMNPNTVGAVEAVKAADVLSGRDEFAMSFIEYFRSMAS